jgi:tRNA threonylcarbamoyladenosine biosynthesis protein TsaE
LRAVRAGSGLRTGPWRFIMTVLSLNECDLAWESPSPEETQRAGEVLGGLLQPGDVVALLGELGSGKTVLVRGIAAGLGCVGEEVHSPSFTLINEYEGTAGRSLAGGRSCLAHMDLYRIRSEDEMLGIGWDDYLRPPFVVAVEWAERASGWLPRDHLRVGLETLDGCRRRLCVQATGPRSAQVVRAWVTAGNFSVEAV